MDIKMIQFQIHGDERGSLIALEENKNIPFTVKRVYYMYDTKPGVHRGFHAHKTLKQILFCTSGACTIMLDSGTEKAMLDYRTVERRNPLSAKDAAGVLQDNCGKSGEALW